MKYAKVLVRTVMTVTTVAGMTIAGKYYHQMNRSLCS